MTPQKIALLTDSCADLSPQLAAENQVFVVPLRILCKDGEYRDGVDIHAADIYARLRSGELPQTSLPAAQDISDAFDAIAAAGYDGVIALMLSGGLSGTYNMVRLLAEERRDLTIRVYDSVSGSLGTGMMILQLAEELRQGMDWQTLTERRVPWLIQNTFPFFSVDTLEYLQKGGRIGKVTAMAGTMLQIKPLITFAADGQLQSIAKVRGRNLVIRKLIELVTQSHNGVARYNLAVANGGEPEEMEEERRLCYVALTRAEEQLYLTCANQRMLFGRTTSNLPSRFTDEIPERCLIQSGRRRTEEEREYGGQWGSVRPERQHQERQDYYAQRREERRNFGGSYSIPVPSGGSRSGKPLGGGISIGGRTPQPTAKRPAAAKAAPPSSANVPFHKGDLVEHTAFGRGMIVSLKPMGGDALLEVAFDSVGTKKLMLKAASQHMKKA